MPVPVSPAILLAVASIALIVGRNFRLRTGKFWGLFCLSGILLAAGCLLAETFQQFRSTSTPSSEVSWVSDPLALAEQWIVLAWGLLTSISTFDSYRLEKEGPDTPAYMMFVLAGLMLVSASNDFITLALSLEIVSLASMATWHGGFSPDHAGSRWQMSPIWFAALASGGLWLGIAILSNSLATTHFDQIQLVLTEAYDPGPQREAIGAPSKLILLSIGIVVISLMARMGLVPFHSSFTSLRQGHSLWIAGFTLQAGHLAGSLGLTRLLGMVFVGVSQPLISLIMIFSLATFFLSSVMAIRGFSPGVKSVSLWLTGMILLEGSIAGIGLMTIAAELDHPGVRWAAFHSGSETLSVIVYCQLAGLLAFSGVYGILGYWSRSDREIEFLEDIKGLGRVTPLPAIALLVSLASLIGCPLTAGFWGRWMILLTAANVHAKWTSIIFTPLAAMRFLMTVALLATTFYAVVVVSVMRELFLESPLAKPVTGRGKGVLIACLIAMLVTLTLGIAPQLAFLPLKSLPSPREIRPAAPQRGSGKNSLSRYLPRTISRRSSMRFCQSSSSSNSSSSRSESESE